MLGFGCASSLVSKTIKPKVTCSTVRPKIYLMLGYNMKSCSFSFLFMHIFDIANSVSEYLQTCGLDILQAW